jgi:hypothetical protein
MGGGREPARERHVVRSRARDGPHIRDVRGLLGSPHAIFSVASGSARQIARSRSMGVRTARGPRVAGPFDRGRVAMAP